MELHLFRWYCRWVLVKRKVYEILLFHYRWATTKHKWRRWVHDVPLQFIPVLSSILQRWLSFAMVRLFMFNLRLYSWYEFVFLISLLRFLKSPYIKLLNPLFKNSSPGGAPRYSKFCLPFIRNKCPRRKIHQKIIVLLGLIQIFQKLTQKMLCIFDLIWYFDLF